MYQTTPVHESPPFWFVWMVSGLFLYGAVAMVTMIALYYSNLKDGNKND